MNSLIVQVTIYESPDFIDLDEVYGFSQSCSSGTMISNCRSPCTSGGT
jgi:hypothetical protein